ncbi:MAG: ABC transporter permease [Kiritimatiellae bacterium]|nr:ABC transporter permease [Kiritimatiellia bacterium]MDD5521116.1 ABC transporter permease [Kiritimatiellia bacterium]
MFERIKHMLIKEFIQIFRDHRMKPIIFALPVIQTLVFGYAVTTDVKNIPTAILDFDNSIVSRELVTKFKSSGYFNIVKYILDDNTMRDLIDRGEVQAVLKMNSGFGADIQAGRTASLQIIIDGTDSNTGGIIMNYASKIGGQYSLNLLASRMSRLQGFAARPGGVELQTRAWFNENLESRNFYVPGVIAMLVMLVTLLLTSMAVVREKEIGTIEQIMVTPITPGEFILGKTIPFAIIALFDVLLVTVVGVFWFDIPIRGSLFLLFICSAIYIMTALGIGLLISTISHTQQQAMMSCFFFFFPAILLSGMMFPIANMPEPIQWLTYINPLRYFLVIVRGIFLKGVGSDILWPQMAALAIMGVIMLWLATKRFRKTIA